MTLKQYIENLSKKLGEQWHAQNILQVRLHSRLTSVHELIDSGKNEYDSESKELESEIDALEKAQRILRQTAKFAHSCSERADNDVRLVQSEKIAGDRGSTVTEEIYQIDDDLKFVQRNTTINGIKYSYIKTSIGDRTNDFEKPSAEITEGFENGERTYYELHSHGGPYERIKKQLGYDYVTTASASGIKIQTKRRNPLRDWVMKETVDSENGQVITIDNPIVDKEGHIIGSHSSREQQTTHKIRGNRLAKNTIIERKCKGKDGKDIVLKSVIMNNGLGIINRTDYVNGQMITQTIMNVDKAFLTVTNYQDAHKVNSTYYTPTDYSYTSWDADNTVFFDKETGLELDEDEITGNERSNPYEIKFKKPEDLFYSQSAFMDGAYMPKELQDLLLNESSDEKATGRSYIGADDELDDNHIKVLKDIQQQREQKNDSRSSTQKQEWD